MNKVFLGGTCAKSDWRKKIIHNLDVDYFNPVVDNWNEDSQNNEEREKLVRCNIHLYVITSEMIGVFSIAEAIESSMTEGKHTIFHVLPDGFNSHQIHSFEAVCKMIEKHGETAYINDNLLVTTRLINYNFLKKGVNDERTIHN